MNRKKVTIIVICFIGVIFIGFLGAVLFLRIDTAFQYVANKNGLIILHHPGRYDQSNDWYQDEFDKFNNTIIAMEIYNQGDRYPGDRVFWDSINRERTPNNYIWGVSNDDWHSIAHSFRNYQHFPLTVLNETTLKSAMIAGAFYCSYEKNGNNQSSPTYGQAMTPKITNIEVLSSVITISSSNADQIVWYNDHTEIIASGSSINTKDLTSSFVRAVLNNSAGLTYTQPFGIIQNQIFNPYSGVDWASATHYKANFHTHTGESANTDPEQVINHFHSANYSILALTSHNENIWPWSEYIDQEPISKSSSAEYYPTLGMLAISGNEASNSHHFSSLFTDYKGSATDIFWKIN